MDFGLYLCLITAWGYSKVLMIMMDVFKGYSNRICDMEYGF